MTDPSGTPRQSLAEQPTTVVPFDRYEAHPDDLAAPRYGEPAPVWEDDRTWDHDRAWDDDRSWDDDRARDDERAWDDGLLDDDGDADADDAVDDGPGSTRPDHGTAPVAVRRADPIAGLLLLLAGMAAGVSVLLVWVNGGGRGVELVRGGIEDARDGAATLADTGSWQPLVVVGGGIALFGLGLLMYVPARTHRFLGVLALLVSVAVAAGVLVPLADADWDLARSAVGAWFTAAVAGLGLLGALKAMSTGPRTSRS